MLRAVVGGGVFAWPAFFFATFANRLGSYTVEVVHVCGEGISTRGGP